MGKCRTLIEVVKKFIEERCIVHDKLSYLKKQFGKDFNEYSPENARPLNVLAGYVNKLGIESSQKAYLGIGVFSYKNTVLMMGEVENSREACKLLNYDISYIELCKLQETELLISQNFTDLKNILKWVESHLTRQNVQRTTHVKLAVVLTLSGLYTQQEAGRLVGCSTVTIRAVLRILGFTDKYHHFTACYRFKDHKWWL